MRPLSSLLCRALGMAVALLPTGSMGVAGEIPLQASAILFTDDFESGLTKWRLSDTQRIRIVPSGSEDHGHVLELQPNGARVRILMKNSRAWNRVAVEGDMLFPDPGHSYLGLIWGFTSYGGRADYASAYVKGNGSYIVANPHWDDNPARELYPEYYADLTGGSRIRIGRWVRFRAELVDGVVQFYIGDTVQPQMVFAVESLAAGELGFRPRVVGERVWLDNVQVRRIPGHSTDSSAPPARPDSRLLTTWESLGPLAATDSLLESGLGHDRRSRSWRPFPVDRRGAVLVARLVDYLGPRTTAYFRTRIPRSLSGKATLRLACLNAVALWSNGDFLGHYPAVETAWFSIASDSTRSHVDIAIPLSRSENVLVLRIRGGQYAGGGFYAALLD